MTDISSEEVDKPEEYVRYRSLKPIENYSAEVTGAPQRQKFDFIKETHPIIQSLAGPTNLTDQSGQPHETSKQQQKTYKRAVDFDSPEIVDTPDRQIYDAASEEQLAGRMRRVRVISDQSTTLLRNNQKNRTDKEKLNPSLIKANLSLGEGSQVTVDNNTEISGLSPCTEISVGSPTEENNSLDPSKVDQKNQKDTMSYQNQLRKIQREELDFDSPERVSNELQDNSSERLKEHVPVTV